MGNLSVREMQASDIPLIIQYWMESTPAHLEGMGVDLAKMPTKAFWEEMLHAQLAQSMQEKKSYCIIWLQDDQPIGHSNVNQIIFGEQAFMHLHLWRQAVRQQGMGSTLVQMTIPYFFKNLQLQRLYCAPYAHNPAPNKTLARVGFTFLESKVATPGFINFEQEINVWVLEA
jgi:RimJ/RimL family protein N-acetyltransferase